MSDPEDRIKSVLLKAGFDLVGITDAAPLAGASRRLDEWLASGFAGGMEYLRRRPSARCDPGRFLPGAQSVIVAAARYETRPGSTGPVAAFALHRDYHSVLESALRPGVEAIRRVEAAARCRTAVDTSPLLERALAARAGLGWIGSSTLLVNPDLGPNLLLGAIVTDLKLDRDLPAESAGCRDCGRCLEACPTGALTAPYRLDARRCISYLTIEKKGPFEPREADAIGGWAFGCDACMLACMEGFPPGRPGTGSSLLEKRTDLWNRDLLGLLDLCEGGFKAAFRETPLLRTGRGRLVRNILSAAKNLGLTWATSRAPAHLHGGTEASRKAARRSLEGTSR